MFSNLPSRNTLPLATQLSATPPARHRFASPVSSARLRVSRSTASSITAWIDAARSMWRCSSGAAGMRGAPSNSASKRSFVIVRPALVEVVEVEAKRAVGLEVDQIVVDELGVFRDAIGGEPH